MNDNGYSLGIMLVFLGCIIGGILGYTLGYDYAKVHYSQTAQIDKYIDSILNIKPASKPATSPNKFPMKMSEFEETDSLKGGYFIGVLQTKDGHFKNVKYYAPLFVTKNEMNVILQLTTEGFKSIHKRLDKLEKK